MIALLAALAWGAPEPERTWVGTDDGDWVALHRRARPDAPPVVLVHGISSNHRFWDLSDERSLAVHLWDAGFDVWNMDLRGHGDARKDPEGKLQKRGWSVDDYGRFDLPAAFTHVREATGRSDLHYVGHSMGGMVLAVYLAHTPEPGLASAVAVGSPLDFRDPDLLVRLLLGGAPLARGANLPTPAGGLALSLLGRSAPFTTDALLHNPDNLAPAAEAKMLRHVVSPLTKGEIAQLAQARSDGAFRSADGSVVYREELGDVTVPMLFVAGRADHVVSPDRVWSFYEAVGSADKQFTIAGRSSGMQGDYGHLDLGCGDHAAQDVFPLVTGWLTAHDPG